MITKYADIELVQKIEEYCPEVIGAISPIIAGGFIRSYYAKEPVSDMDLYFECPTSLNDFYRLLLESGWTTAADTENAITVIKGGSTVQLVKFLYQDAIGVIEAIDFTICAACCTTDIKPMVIMHDRFLRDVRNKELVFKNSDVPIGSLIRAFKFTSRGYSISEDCIYSIAKEIIEVGDIKKPYWGTELPEESDDVLEDFDLDRSGL